MTQSAPVEVSQELPEGIEGNEDAQSQLQASDPGDGLDRHHAVGAQTPCVRGVILTT